MEFSVANLFRRQFKYETGTTVQVELTAKRWKLLMLFALGSGVLGSLSLLWQIWKSVYQPIIEGQISLSGNPLSSFTDTFVSFFGTIGLIFLLFSIIIGVYAKFMAWWYHG
ncbi:MAG: hypothetical protein VX617_04800 [Pseudomonadota bacterium]|nr:hypothetical protein [Pseudomonadota bacterium]